MNCDENNFENSEETHFLFDLYDRNYIGRRDDSVPYNDAASAKEGRTVILRMSRGPNSKFLTHCSYLIAHPETIQFQGVPMFALIVLTVPSETAE